MSRVRTLVDSLKSTTATFLGSEYHELGDVYTIENNPRLDVTKGYGVIAEEINLVVGNLGFNTVDHTFTTIITDNYITTRDGDIDKQDAVINLLDKVQDVYDEYVRTKLGLNSIILIITDMSVSIEELDEENTVVARCSYVIKYRKQVSC